jgi:hypothetical protein
MRPDLIEQGRQLKMRMDIDQARHDDRLFQPHDPMAPIVPDHRRSFAERQDPPILHNDGTVNERNAVRPNYDPVCLDDHRAHTVPFGFRSVNQCVGDKLCHMS